MILHLRIVGIIFFFLFAVSMGFSSTPAPDDMEEVTPPLTYKVGMGQILVEGGAVEANLNRAVSMIDQAAEKGCQIIILPECLDWGWTYPSAKKLAKPIPGPYSNILSKSANSSKTGNHRNE